MVRTTMSQEHTTDFGLRIPDLGGLILPFVMWRIWGSLWAFRGFHSFCGKRRALRPLKLGWSALLTTAWLTPGEVPAVQRHVVTSCVTPFTHFFLLFVCFDAVKHDKLFVSFEYVHNMFELVLMRWMKLEPIIQSEVSQKEKHQHSILRHIYGI